MPDEFELVVHECWARPSASSSSPSSRVVVSQISTLVDPLACETCVSAAAQYAAEAARESQLANASLRCSWAMILGSVAGQGGIDGACRGPGSMAPVMDDAVSELLKAARTAVAVIDAAGWRENVGAAIDRRWKARPVATTRSCSVAGPPLAALL